MLRLLLVKDVQYSDIHAQDNNGGLSHGTSILKYLILNWAKYERGVCTDSHFASVSSAEKMIWLCLQFIGVVKTATKKSLMNYLSGM